MYKYTIKFDTEIQSKKTGQAIAEIALILPLLIILLFGITFFTRIYIVWTILTEASRHGVFLIVYNNFTVEQVKSEIVDYLKEVKIDKYSLHRNVSKQDIEVKLDLVQPSKVKITCLLKVPKVLLTIPGIQNPFPVYAQSECYNDSWYFGFPSNKSRS
ncbi:MAG: TadE/TadG family type IV pilus assembly protein [Elusimicrobiota bacterium]|nr:TadE/TadG family type IV pilus assembly protein [Elusimicrobiota bacterium]